MEDSWWNRISRGFALDLATILAALYAVGLLIVNLDLGHYGVAAIDLARPEYVMVGLLWAMLVLVSTTMILFAIWLIRDVAQPDSIFEPMNRSSRIRFAVSLLLFASLIYAFVLLVISNGTLDDLLRFWFGKFLIGCLFQGSLLLLIAWALNILVPRIRDTPGFDSANGRRISE